MCIHFDFDFRKAAQALNYLAQSFEGKVNKMKAIKLIYFADRYHLRKYGRPITNDDYIAMQYGPVGSKAKDIAESSDFLDDMEREYSTGFIKREGYDLLSISDVDSSVFSDSDIEALDFALEHFGKFNEFNLAKISHAYPEWRKYETALERRSSISMDYEDFFRDPPAEDEHLDMLGGRDLFAMSEEDKEEILDFIKEQHKIKNFWESRSDSHST